MKSLISILFLLFITKTLYPQTHSVKKDSTVTIVDYIQPKPHFPGGDIAFKHFLARNIRWPNTGADIQGKVIVSFIIEKNGALTHLTIVRSLSSQFDKEAIRVIKLSQHWVPATQNGKPIRCKFYVPVQFKMDE